MGTQSTKLKTQNYNSNPKTELKSRCYNFSLSLIKFLKSIDEVKLYRPLLEQLLRSSTSTGANIIEAKSASSRRDFIKFFEIALKSANETKYWLSLIKDSFNFSNMGYFVSEVSEISSMIASSILTMKNKKSF